MTFVFPGCVAFDGPVPCFALMVLSALLFLFQVDLVGGYYDAGDNVKFGLPMAFTVTMMSWSILEYGKQMASAGELQYEFLAGAEESFAGDLSLAWAVEVEVDLAGDLVATFFVWKPVPLGFIICLVNSS